MLNNIPQLLVEWFNWKKKHVDFSLQTNIELTLHTGNIVTGTIQNILPQLESSQLVLFKTFDNLLNTSKVMLINILSIVAVSMDETSFQLFVEQQINPPDEKISVLNLKRYVVEIIEILQQKINDSIQILLPWEKINEDNTIEIKKILDNIKFVLITLSENFFNKQILSQAIDNIKIDIGNIHTEIIDKQLYLSFQIPFIATNVKEQERLKIAIEKLL